MAPACFPPGGGPALPCGKGSRRKAARLHPAASSAKNYKLVTAKPVPIIPYFRRIATANRPFMQDFRKNCTNAQGFNPAFADNMRKKQKFVPKNGPLDKRNNLSPEGKNEGKEEEKFHFRRLSAGSRGKFFSREGISGKPQGAKRPPTKKQAATGCRKSLFEYFGGAAHVSLSGAKLWSASEVQKVSAWEGALPLPFPQAL